MCPDSQNNKNHRVQNELKFSNLNHRLTIVETKVHDMCLDLYGHGLEREGLISVVLDLRSKIDTILRRSARREAMYWALMLSLFGGLLAAIWRLVTLVR